VLKTRSSSICVMILFPLIFGSNSNSLLRVDVDSNDFFEFDRRKFKLESIEFEISLSSVHFTPFSLSVRSIAWGHCCPNRYASWPGRFILHIRASKLSNHPRKTTINSGSVTGSSTLAQHQLRPCPIACSSGGVGNRLSSPHEHIVGSPAIM
jgi:hypothetical protein